MPLYELSCVAEEDLHGIVEYTLKLWGSKKVRQYTKKLSQCMESMAKGDGSYKKVNDLYPSMRLKHCQHHYIFGLMREKDSMLVIAIFHERMNLMERLKERLK